MCSRSSCIGDPKHSISICKKFIEKHVNNLCISCIFSQPCSSSLNTDPSSSTTQSNTTALALPVSALDPAAPQNFTGIYSLLSKKQRAVALETAVFLAQNPESLSLKPHERNRGVLVDTGAQRSLISRETVDRLGLRMTSIEPALLQGFEQAEPKNLNYQVAEIIMGKPGHKPI